LAAQAGADAVKLQSYTPARYASRSDPERLNRVTRFTLDESAIRTLFREAATAGISLFSTPLTEDMVPLLASLCPVLKVASGDITFEPLVRAVAATGKPVILSTGLSTVDEIDRAVGWIRSELGPADLAERLVLLQCVSAYPTPIEEANVKAIPFLADRYRVRVGFSNHTIGPEACLAAVALGADLVEVHFTDTRRDRAFRDHQLSFEPAELKSLAASIVQVRASLGCFGKAPQPSELPQRHATRKGVVAARDLAAGAVLTRDDLMFARPATEFPASDVNTLIGRQILGSVRAGELIRRDNIATH